MHIPEGGHAEVRRGEATGANDAAAAHSIAVPAPEDVRRATDGPPLPQLFPGRSGPRPLATTQAAPRPPALPPMPVRVHAPTNNRASTDAGSAASTRPARWVAPLRSANPRMRETAFRPACNGPIQPPPAAAKNRWCKLAIAPPLHTPYETPPYFLEYLALLPSTQVQNPERCSLAWRVRTPATRFLISNFRIQSSFLKSFCSFFF